MSDFPASKIDSTTPEGAPVASASGSALRITSLLVLVAALTTPLLTPHATSPRVLPVPPVGNELLRQKDEREQERSSRARQALLPASIRVVGELFRRTNLASVKRHVDHGLLRDQLREEVELLERAGRSAELLDLRALQGELFVAAVHAFAEGNIESSDLLELSGDFSRLGRRRWIHDGQVLITDADLRLLHRLQWGKLTGTFRRPGYGPSLNELRAAFTLHVLYPPLGEPEAQAHLESISHVKALAEVDPHYPVHYALGLLYARTGQQEAAALELERHQASSPENEYLLSSRNLLVSVASGL